jgi:hypothetical protein
MANLTGYRQAFGSELTDHGTTIKEGRVLVRGFDLSGNEYVYLKGVASTVAGSVVTFDEAGVTTLIAGNAIGPVAIAMAATVANEYGWYLIWGSGSAACDTVADDKLCYIDGTAGRVDDLAVAGDLVVGLMTRSTDSGGFCTVHASYPFVTDALG